MNVAASRGNIQVILEGRGPVTLRPNDHVAMGGEGSIYRVSDLVVKMYLDPVKMRQRGTPDKVRKLAALLKHPYIMTPIGLAVTAAGDPVGHYLPYVEDPPVGHPLSRVFTNDFYQSEGFTDKLASKLVDRMRETVVYAHGCNALLIDPNELNWFALAVRKDPEPRIIDVDSWVVGPMPPTVAVMPSIRDWHAKKFGRESDWFSWAVVTFQVYTGIHPYKGTLDGYARTDMEQRMKDNASVFSSGVRLNRAVRDFSCIPAPLLDWYEATFQKGERAQPPSPFDTGVTTPRAAQVLRAVVTGKTGILVFEKLLGYPGDRIVRTFYCGVALLASGRLIDIATKRQIAVVSSTTCEVVKAGRGWLIGNFENRQAFRSDSGQATFVYVSEASLRSEVLQLRMQAHRLIGYENRMFAVGDSGLTEIKSNLFGERLISSAGQTWGIIANSTKWFSGVGVLDIMGAKFVIAPFGENAVAQVPVRELNGIRIITAKAGNRFVSLIGIDKSGDYQKVELTFDREYRTYKAWVGTTDGPELNLAILPKGVCATIVKDGELDIFVPTSGSLTRVEDNQIATTMLLSNWGDRVIYVQDGEVWAVRMK
jgi:hypothetical protein